MKILHYIHRMEERYLLIITVPTSQPPNLPTTFLREKRQVSTLRIAGRMWIPPTWEILATSLGWFGKSQDWLPFTDSWPSSPSKTLFSSSVSWFHQTLLGPSYEQHLPECGVMWCQQYWSQPHVKFISDWCQLQWWQVRGPAVTVSLSFIYQKTSIQLADLSTNASSSRHLN